MTANGVSYESKLEYRADEQARIYLRETVEYSDGETSVDDQPLTDEQAALVARSANLHYKLLSALEELADLMNSVRSGDYKPDSFTCQPARRIIAEARMS
jgi:hypothetical protein